MDSAIFVAEAKEHARFSNGVRYRFEVRVSENGRAGHIDATLIRSQRADEPIWADSTTSR